MRATLTNYHQSPRKVRLVADLIRGKSMSQAKDALAFLPKKSSLAVAKLLDSAVANARSRGVSTENLFVKKITVDKGSVLKRTRPFARGRAGIIRKTMSIISLELGTRQVTGDRGQVTARKVSKKTAKNSASDLSPVT